MLYDPKWDAAQETKLEPWRQLLLDGADYIEKHGWFQGFYCAIDRDSSQDGPVCLLGATNMIAFGDAADEALSRPWSEAFRKLKSSIGDVAAWNDTTSRTAAEVVAKMREVALAP